VKKNYAAVTDKIKSILPEESKDNLEEMNSKVEVFFPTILQPVNFPITFLLIFRRLFQREDV
jgi:hypothetical protein